MSTHLHSGKKTAIKPLLVALVIMLFTGLAQRSQAQVYFEYNDAVSTSGTNDAIKKVNYDGTSLTQLANNFTNSPGLLALDLPNNRAFVYEAFSSSPPTNLAIKVVNLSNNSVSATIPLTVTGRIMAIRYDAVNDYIYYTVQDATPTTASSIDGLYKVKPDGTGNVAVATGFCDNPQLLSLDMPNNRAFVYENLFADHGVYIINLSTGATISHFSTSAGSGGLAGIEMEYDPQTDYLYFVTQDGTTTSTGVNDGLFKQKPDGTGYAVVAASAYQNPYSGAFDFGHNLAYVYDNSSKAIFSVNLSTGAVGTFQSATALGLTIGQSPQLTGLALPFRPVLTSTTPGSISSTSVTVGGNITRSDASVTDRGVVYSTSNSTPTLSDSKFAIGNGNGAFSGSLSGLAPVTTYYVRAYATSAAGTSYGAISSFTTLSNDASMSGITLSAGSLSPTFSAATLSYTALVPYSSSSITVTPTHNQANATIKVNGTAVNSGSASGAIALSVGANTITVVGTAQDGSTTKTYTLTVTRDKQSQTITFPALSAVTYGDADYAPTVSASTGLTVSLASDNASVATIVSGKIHIVGAGTASITASQPGDANNYAATNVVQSLTVNKKGITVTATAQSKTYGDADPALTYTNTALISGDAFTGALTRATGTAVGTYAISQGTLALSSNYSISFVSANLTINKKTINVTANAVSKTYGDADPSLTYNHDALVAGDSFVGILSRAAGSNAGTYAITQGTLTLSGNYTLNFTGANFIINKKTINAAATAQTKTYGDADPTFTYTNDALVSGDSFSGSLTRDAGENVGSYAIKQGSLALSSNYTLNFTNSTLAIGKKTISVTANAASKTYGDADPAFTYSNGALISGDAFTGSLTRDAGENVGSYAIKQGSLSLSSNYTLSFTGANLSIGKKSINVTANAASKTYGDADPALTYTNDALISGDAFTGSLTRDAGESAGTYAIKQGSLALSNNYTLNYTAASLTIGKKAINVTANAQIKTYGDADPAFTYSADALLNGDTFSGALTRDAGNDVGTYAIKLGSLSAGGNYSLNYTGANLTINSKFIVVTADAKSKTYGDADPALTYSLSVPLVAGDSFTGSIARPAGESAGTYIINRGTLDISSNYNMLFTNAYFIISPKTLNVTANAVSKTYGDADPVFTYTSDALAPGNTFTGALDRNYGEDAGTYAMTIGTLSAGSNYTINLTTANLTITRKTITVKADAISKTFGDADPALTYTNDALANGDSFNGSLTRDAGETVGTYAIKQGSLTLSNNYTLNFTGNTFTIGKHTVNITANSATKTYGAADPTIRYFTDGSISNSDLTGALGRVSGENVGTYAINLGTLALADTADYTLNLFGSANLTISKAVLNVKADDATRLYGQANPAFTVSYSGFKFSDSQSSLSTLPVASSTATVGSAAGTYPITVSGGSANNYTLSYTGGTLTVQPVAASANLTLTVSTQSTLVASTGSSNVNYTTTVSADATYFTVTPTASNASATITVNGVSVTSGTAYQVPLNASGATSVVLTCTSADGSTHKTYGIIVNKTGSNQAGINLKLSTGTSLIASTGSANYNYTTSVNSSLSSLTVTAVAFEQHEAITVNGTTVASGTASQPIALNASGTTTVNIVSTAQDGVTTKTYAIVISKNGSNQAALTLKLASGNPLVSSTSGTANYNYTTSVSSVVGAIGIIPTALDTTATITVNGTTVPSGTTWFVNLRGASSIINIVGTAQDGVTTKTYAITVAKNGNNQAGLTFKLSTGNTIATTTGTADVNYTTSVSSSLASLSIIPTTTDPNATVTVNGVAVASGSASQPVALNATGSTTIHIVGTAQDGVTTKTYDLIVNKNGSNLATLALKLSTGNTLVNSAGSADFNYTTSVDYNLASLSVTPTTTDPFATAKVNGVAVASGTASAPIALNASGTTTINATGLAEDGVTTKTYAIVVSKNGSNNANLSFKLNTNGVLVTTTGGANVNYYTSVDPSITSINLTTTTADANASINLNGSAATSGTAMPIALSTDGPLTYIYVVGTAQDGVTTKTYLITVARNGSNQAGISLKTSAGTNLITSTGPANYNYTTSVSSSLSSITITPTAFDPNQTITVNGSVVASGMASDPIDLTASNTTTINIVSTAQDGFTTKTYQLLVSRNGSNVASARYTLKTGAATVLSVGATTYNASTTVASSLDGVTVTPISTDANATLTVNGAPIVSNTKSKLIALNYGTNVITVVCTAEDGVTQLTYTATVIRPSVSTNNIQTISTNRPATDLGGALDVNVRAALSPNGDGINDVLTIENVERFPDNHLSIMNANGALVYEAKGYNNSNIVFDGHSNKNGAMQKPGTYFYSLEYHDGDNVKRKTGYIIIKY